MSKPNPPGVIDATYDEGPPLFYGVCPECDVDLFARDDTAECGGCHQWVFLTPAAKGAVDPNALVFRKRAARREIVALVLQVVGNAGCLTWGDHATLRDLCKVLQEKP